MNMGEIFNDQEYVDKKKSVHVEDKLTKKKKT